MAIDPEVEEVLTTLIDTVEERVAEVKSLLSEQVGTMQALQARIESGDAAGAGAHGDAAQWQALADRLDRLEQQVQGLGTQQKQINAFLTGVLKLMMTKQIISQQEMVEVFKATK